MGRRRTPGNAKRRRMVALAMLVAFVAASLAGCSSGDGGPSGATVPEAPTTSSTVAADEWAIPDTIDEAYVERVLAELDRIDGDAARIIVAEGELVPAAVDRLRAIYGTDELNLQLELWGENVSKRFEGVKRPPGDRRTAVDSVSQPVDDCIVAEARTDYSAVAERPPAQPRPSVITLRVPEESFDPSRFNPTRWVFHDVRLLRDPADAQGQC